MAIKKYGIPEKPNSSHAINSEAIGQLVTPQKTADSPIAAAKAGGRPKREPATQPKVAPTKKPVSYTHLDVYKRQVVIIAVYMIIKASVERKRVVTSE